MKRYKKDCDSSYSIGVFPTLELLNARAASVSRVLISSCGARNRGIQQIEALCQQHHIRTEIADRAVRQIAESDNCYVIGEFAKYALPLAPANHIVLVHPSDCGNLGSILRTALAYGITNLAIIQPAVDMFDPKVIRASMGAIFRLNCTGFGSFDDYCSRFGNCLYPFMTDGSTPLPRAHFEQPFSLIFGNEGAGLGDEFHQVGESIRIPQSAAVDSLNIAVAVGIALYAASVQCIPQPCR